MSGFGKQLLSVKTLNFQSLTPLPWLLIFPSVSRASSYCYNGKSGATVRKNCPLTCNQCPIANKPRSKPKPKKRPPSHKRPKYSVFRQSLNESVNPCQVREENTHKIKKKSTFKTKNLPHMESFKILQFF